MRLSLSSLPDPSIIQLLLSASASYGVPPAIALGVASHESGFNPSAQNPNSSAAGVMQLTAATQQTLGVTNPYDAQQNINGGVSLLARYYQQYGNWNDALQAYADGPATVGKQPPSAMAQQFISYVESYDPSTVGVDSAQLADFGSAVNYGDPGQTDWGMVTAAAIAGLVGWALLVR